MDRLLNLTSRFVFGNMNGWHHNRQSADELRAARAGSSAIARADTPEAARLRQDGVLLLPPVHDGAVLGEVQAAARTLLDDPASCFSDTDLAFNREIREPLRRMPSVAKLLTPRLIDIAQAYFGAYIKVTDVMGWRNLGLSPERHGEEVFSNRWHCDGGSLNNLSLFVYLTDVGEQDGPFHVIARPRSQWLMRRGFRNRNRYGMPESEIERPGRFIRATGPAGSVIFAAVGRCLHRAGEPLPGRHREIVKFGLRPSSEPLPPDWPERLLAERDGTGSAAPSLH